MSGKYFKVHKTVLLSWIASYALVLFIPLIINSAIYIQASNIIEKQITDSNVSMLQQFQKEIDGHVQEIENLGLRISVNQNLDTLMKVHDEKEILSSFALVKQARDMNDEFSAYTLSSRFVESVYVFFDNKDLVWWHSNFYDKKTFYEQYIDNENTSYEKWLKSMGERYMNVNSPFYIKGASRNGKKTIAHFQSLPINLTSIQANLVITMDEEKLNDYIQNVSKINNSFVYILDKNDNVLFSSDYNSKFLPNVKYSEMNEAIGLIHQELNKQDVVISYISSKASEWKYVCVIPNSVFKEKVVYVRNLTIICFLICIILGGAAIAVLAKKNYNPLNELVKSLKSKYDDKSKNLNEFSLIKNSIMDAYNENEFISKKLEAQNNALRLNFISRLLRGRFNGNPPDMETLNSYGISFDSEYFIVIVFYIEQSSELKIEEIDSKIFENIIAVELKDLISDKAKVYQSEVEDMIACLLNVKEDDLDNWRKNIDTIVNRLQDILKEKVKLNITTAVSGVNKNISGINIGYQEAMEAMEYRLFSKDSNIVYYDDIKQLQNRSYNYYYTMENEYKLINSIKVGDFEKAKEIVDKVIYENFSARVLSIAMSKCVMFDLINTFIKALNNEGALEGMSFLEDNFIGRLVTRKSIDDMKAELLNCLKLICDYMFEYNEDKSKSKSKLTEKVNELIEEKYFDMNLNISTLAEILGMNSKYMSAAYKDVTGESILDVINKVRVNKAKILLKADLNISDTAEKVGFSNSNALIRAFKKCEGMTPGQFKEMCKT